MRVFKCKVDKFFKTQTTLSVVLQQLTSLHVEELADAAKKGAVWIQKNSRGKILRIRRLDASVMPQDLIFFYYDKKVLSLPMLKKLESIYEDKNYGIWIKPAGVVSQGSQASDHASLLRYVEIEKQKEVYLVHRLDRETQGLVLIAYSKDAAAKLSHLFQQHLIKKIYQAIVVGELRVSDYKEISTPLDDKEALTQFWVREVHSGLSLLEIELKTGRLHQIRRHLSSIKLPILGDPLYGKNNKNQTGMKLLAYSVAFRDPWSHKNQEFKLPDSLNLNSL